MKSTIFSFLFLIGFILFVFFTSLKFTENKEQKVQFPLTHYCYHSIAFGHLALMGYICYKG